MQTRHSPSSSRGISFRHSDANFLSDERRVWTESMKTLANILNPEREEDAGVVVGVGRAPVDLELEVLELLARVPEKATPATCSLDLVIVDPRQDGGSDGSVERACLPPWLAFQDASTFWPLCARRSIEPA